MNTGKPQSALIGHPWPDIIGALVKSMRSLWLATISRGRPHETNIPSPEPEASAQARVPGPDEDQGGPGHSEPAASEGPETNRRDGPEEVEVGKGGSYRFPRSARIRLKSDIEALFRRGERRRTGHLDVYVADSPALRPRLALVVPKHGHKIVARNRVKRRLREAARQHLLPRCLERGVALDILIRARPAAYEVAFEQLKEEIVDLAEQLCSPGS